MDKQTEEWLNAIKWKDECLSCKAKHEGKCPDIECAQMNYDKNGNKIPLSVYHADGNTLYKYLKAREGK